MLARKLTDRFEDKDTLIAKLLEQSDAMVRGDFSKRTVCDYNDDMLTRLANNLNTLCDNAQLESYAGGSSLEQTVSTFIDVISSFTNLDFKHKLPISENGTVLDAIATGINILGDELEMSAASRSELEQERNRLNEAQSFAKVGSWEIESDGKFSISRECCRILEIDPDKEYSFSEPYRAFRMRLHPEDTETLHKFIPQVHAKVGRHSLEVRLNSTNGIVRHILCIVEVIREPANEFPLAKGTIQDVTESKITEEALIIAKRKAEELNNAKSRFLANVSHEIRTPLNGILGLTDIMINETKNQEHRKYLDLIRYSGKNLTQLINDTLDLSKIESGKLKLENITFDFRNTISSTIGPYVFLAQQKGCSLTFDIDSAIPEYVIGDPTRISQIIVNLISNAIKFTDEGRIEIHFGSDTLNKNEIVINGSVKDNGIGISPDRIGSIFQTFSQADESINRRYGGTGLGLSIVKNLLVMMNGDIKVESVQSPGRKSGTTFKFNFKLGIPESFTKSETSAEASTTTTLARPFDVLLVDDNKINLLVARKLVESIGGVVTTAVNGLEAIKKAAMQEYDVILMDIQMPELNGYDATIRLREMNYSKPIIALSANAFPEDVKNSIDAGMNDHIQKPFSARQLLEVISRHVTA